MGPSCAFRAGASTSGAAFLPTQNNSLSLSKSQWWEYQYDGHFAVRHNQSNPIAFVIETRAHLDQRQLLGLYSTIEMII